MWLRQVSVYKNVHSYISPKLCLTPGIKSKYFRISECVGIGQTTVFIDFLENMQNNSDKTALEAHADLKFTFSYASEYIYIVLVMKF